MAGEENNEVYCCNPNDHNLFVMKNLQEQFVEGRNCDLEVRLRDGCVFVHKCLTDMFFTKIGADIENDMFYLDLKEFSHHLLKPLIDMMYHGILSVPTESIQDIERISSYVGFKQAKELIAENGSLHLQNTNSQVTSCGNEDFVIKSEPPDDELGDSGLLNRPGYISDMSDYGEKQSRKRKREGDGNCIYEVFTPNPDNPDKKAEEILPSLKFKEDAPGLSELIRDKDKATVTVTDKPYDTVKQILKRNEMFIPQANTDSSDGNRSMEEAKNKRQFPNRGKKIRQWEEVMSPHDKSASRSPSVYRKSFHKKLIYGLSEKVEKNIAKNTVGISAAMTGHVSVTHVASPGPKKPKPDFDYKNEQNFSEAAATRMLESSVMSKIADRLGKKPGKRVKQLEIKAKLIPVEDEPPRKEEVKKKLRAKVTNKTTHTTTGVQTTMKQEIEEPSTCKTIKISSMLRKRPERSPKPPKSPSVTRTVVRESDEESEESEPDLGAYLEGNKEGNKNKPVKYFPPAGIVPEGCKSSYAQSHFTKTKKIYETITKSNGDVMLIRKEIPVRRTIFNPKKSGDSGVAAVVVCHPTKPVVRL